MVLKCITQENCHRKKSLNTYRDNLQASHLFANEQRTQHIGQINTLFICI